MCTELPKLTTLTGSSFHITVFQAGFLLHDILTGFISEWLSWKEKPSLKADTGWLRYLL